MKIEIVKENNFAKNEHAFRVFVDGNVIKYISFNPSISDLNSAYNEAYAMNQAMEVVKRIEAAGTLESIQETIYSNVKI